VAWGGDEGGDGSPEPATALTRRRALAGAGLLGAGAVGWTLFGITNEPDPPLPTVPTDEMADDGWVRTDQRTETVAEIGAVLLTVRAVANTVQYGDQGLVDEVRARGVTVDVGGQTSSEPLREAAPDAFDQHLSIFAATRIDLGPDVDNLPLGLGRAEVMSQVRTAARDNFEQTMVDSGLRNVESTGTDDLGVDTGQTATLDRFRADFPFEGGTATAAGQEFDVPSTELKMAGYLAVWHRGDFVLIGAGAHPDENYSDTVEEESAVGTATLSLDLGLRPASYRDELLGYIRRIR
jgi:hypothetical protein